MSKKTTQELTLNVIEKANSKYEEMRDETITLNIDGKLQEFTIKINKEFSPMKIKELIREFIKNMDFAKNVNREGFGNVTEPYLMYLIIKHFTNLGESIPKNFNEQLASLTKMINSSAFFQILSKLDEKEIEKLKVDLDIMLKALEDKTVELESLKEEYYGSKIKSNVLMD